MSEISVFQSREVVREVLEARGFGWAEPTRPNRVLRSKTDMGFSRPQLDLHMDKYKFRRLLRWLIERRTEGPFAEAFLCKQIGCKQESLQEYLEALAKDRLVSYLDSKWGIVPEVEIDSFGPTLEWYVAQKLAEKLHWHATPSVYLDDIDCNDFDVVAVRGSDIVMVECKTTEPDRIEEDDITTFCKRHNFLGADLSLLLVDTDKPVERLAARVDSFARELGDKLPAPVKVDPGAHVFWIRRYIYVGNTYAGAGDGVLRTLQTCLRDYHTRVRRLMFWG